MGADESKLGLKKEGNENHLIGSKHTQSRDQEIKPGTIPQTKTQNDKIDEISKNYKRNHRNENQNHTKKEEHSRFPRRKGDESRDGKENKERKKHTHDHERKRNDRNEKRKHRSSSDHPDDRFHSSNHHHDKDLVSSSNERAKSRKRGDRQDRNHKQKRNSTLEKPPQAFSKNSKKSNADTGDRIKKRKKNKHKLEKNKNFHSAPDLSNTSMDDSKVGAWLNAAYLWQQENPGWRNNYAFPYATLPGIYSHPFNLEVDAPRPIVDGMGSPVGTVYPDGTFVPDNDALSSNIYSNYGSTSALQYSTPPFFPIGYAYPYTSYPQFYPHSHDVREVNGEHSMKERAQFKNRSLSHNHIDAIGNDVISDRNKSRGHHKKKMIINKPRSVPVDGEVSIQESVSSIKSDKDSSHPCYSDIVETRESSLPVQYQANRQISVDNVKHAEVIPVRDAQTGPSDSSIHGSSESMSDSSFNDVILDDNDVTSLQHVIKPSSSQDEASNVKLFQPVSKQEVFIDDYSDEARHDNMHGSNKSNDNPPIMRLCEKESIKATSFLAGGEKVFCITKTTLSATPRIVAHNQSAVPKSFDAASKSEKKHQYTNGITSQGRISGTWFGLTGSPLSEVNQTSSDVKSKPEVSQTSLDVKVEKSSAFRNMKTSKHDQSDNRLFAPRSSTSSSANDFETINSSPRTQHSDNERKRDSRLVRQLANEENNSAFDGLVQRKQKDSSNQVAKAAETKITSKFNNKEAAAPTVNQQRTDQPVYSKPRIQENHSLESLDSEENNNFTNKLVRIDSHDSFTMKRRFRYHRRSSSQSDKPPTDFFERRATLGSVSHNDIREAHSLSGGTKSTSGISPYHHEDDNPFHDVSDTGIDSFLYRAKSEEALKREMSKSMEALMTEVSPRQKKETLQERAARILGISSEDASKARVRHTTRSVNPQSDTHLYSRMNANSRAIAVTPSASASGNIPQSSTVTPVGSPPSASKSEVRDCGSFAVSVTESMLGRPQNKFKIRSIEDDDDSHSSIDVSTISDDSFSVSQASSCSSQNFKDGFAVEDSVLEDAPVPSRVKPHKEKMPYPSAKEYKIPEDIFVRSNVDSSLTTILSPSMGQASIVASYANSIYDKTPGTPTAHAHDLSDDTTESEGFIQPRKSKSPLQQTNAPTKVINGSDSNVIANTIGRPPDKQPISTNALRNPRVAESPVPIASHSAPLTSGELDIIMQLYNSADESASTCSRNISEKSGHQQRRYRSNNVQKQKIAEAIGFDVRNIDQGSRRDNFEKMEDFDIKIFPNKADWSQSNAIAQNKQFSSNSDQATAPDNPNDVVEAMQSLGLNPEKAWLVSL